MHVVLLETTVPRGFHHVTTLRDAGVEVSFVTDDLSRYAAVPGFEEHHHATRVVEVPDTRHGAGLAQRLDGQLGENPVDGVVCVHDQHVVAANRLARDLGTPHERPETVAVLRDKAAVRRRLDRAGLGTLRWKLVEQAADLPAAAAGLGYPLVVKPLANYGSIGVTTCWQQADLPAGAAGPFLLEQYVAGRHVSAEVLVQDGRLLILGFAERRPAPPGVTAELGGHFPARFEGLGAARELVRGLVEALEVSNSALHVELMITAGGPQLIEVNARVAGHVVSEQITRALDRNVTLDLLRIAVGQPLDPLDEPVNTLALRQFWTWQSGTLRAVQVPDLPPEVVRCEPVVRPGDPVRALRHNFDRLGYVLTESPDPQRAIEVADAVAREVRFDIEADEPVEAIHPYGRHAVLLLDDDEPERVLDAAAAATRHLSVVWTGDSHRGAAVRRHWSARFAGCWLDPIGLESAVKELHAVDRIDTVVHLAPGLTPLAARIRAVVGLPCDADGGGASRDGLSHIAVVLQDGGGRVMPWALLAEDGTDVYVTHDAALIERAIEATQGRGSGPAVLSCRLSGPDPVVRVETGIEGPLRALCDASLRDDLVAALLTSGLTGELPAPPTVRHPGAVLRRLAAPPGRFRVAEATPAETLYADPAVAYVESPMPAGFRHRPETTTAVDRLRYVTVGPDHTVAASQADRVERSLGFRTVAQDRTHVLLVDRFGSAGWTRSDGTPVLPPDRFRTTVITNRPPGDVSGDAAPDRLLHADVFDRSVLTTLADAVHAGDPVDRIACGTEHLLAGAAALRGRWGVPGDDVRRSRAVRDKAEMKRIARRAGIPHAPGAVLYEPASLWRLLDEHSAVVVKPRDRSGAQGVRILRDRAAAEDWLRSDFLPGAHLAEAWQAGPVCHIDAVVHHGIVAWDVSRYGDDALAFAEGRPVTSWSVDDDRLRAHAAELLSRVLEAWEITSGVVHLEAFDAGEHLVFNELAGRAGGGGIVPAFELSRGIDLRHAKLALDAGDDPRRLLHDPAAAYAGWIVHYSPGGRLLAYDDSAVAGSASYRQVSAAVGEDVPIAAFRGTGLATYCFSAASAAEVRELLLRATTDIDMRFAPNTTDKEPPR